MQDTDPDSSEDENIEMLREATDKQFFQDSLYKTGKTESSKIHENIPCKESSRYSNANKLNDLNVTPEYQTFVARHLSKIIDSQIKETVCATKPPKADIAEKGGIRLFGSSNSYICCDDEAPVSLTKHNNKKPKKENDDDVSNKKLEEAAVSAEWILSQKCIAGWEPNKKGEIIVLKPSEVEIKGKTKQESKSIAVPVKLTPEERKEKKALKRKRRAERLKQEKLVSENGNSNYSE